MSDDQPFFTPNRNTAPQPIAPPGDVLWTLRKLDQTARAELKDDTAEGAGFEVRVWRNGGFLSARRFASREVADIEAVALLAWFEQQGWQKEGAHPHEGHPQ
jgi:hypothetical protein